MAFLFQGCGKSIVVKQFADMLGYHVEPIMLYQVGINKVFHYNNIWYSILQECANICHL